MYAGFWAAAEKKIVLSFYVFFATLLCNIESWLCISCSDLKTPGCFKQGKEYDGLIAY